MQVIYDYIMNLSVTSPSYDEIPSPPPSSPCASGSASWTNHLPDGQASRAPPEEGQLVRVPIKCYY